MILQLPTPPSTNRLWRTTKHGRTYQPAEVVAWKRTAAWTAKSIGIEPITGPVGVRIALLPRMTVRGKATKRRIDLDNAIKAVLDALNGVAYADDSQVIDIHARIGQPVLNGGLTVEVVPVCG